MFEYDIEAGEIIDIDLAMNVVPGTATPVDATLTIEGAAADAKRTGLLIEAERAAREGETAALRTALGGEIAARESAVAEVASSVENERTERESAVSALESADETLRNGLMTAVKKVNGELPDQNGEVFIRNSSIIIVQIAVTSVGQNTVTHTDNRVLENMTVLECEFRDPANTDYLIDAQGSDITVETGSGTVTVSGNFTKQCVMHVTLGALIEEE